jgi:hypothetical protein
MSDRPFEKIVNERRRSSEDVQDRLITAADDAHAEASRAASTWPPLNSAHEGYGVLAEEFRELEGEVFKRQGERSIAKMRAEAVQLAAVALRFIADICDGDRGRK